MDNMDATTERPVIAATRTVKRRGPRLSRADRTPLGLWFWEIDRVLLLLVSMLVAIGLVAVAEASPDRGSMKTRREIPIPSRTDHFPRPFSSRNSN